MLCLIAATALGVLATLPEVAQSAGPPIEDPSGKALDAFYRALEHTETGTQGAVTRVLHLGDSSMGFDGLAHPIRERLQERFGDAGPGFLPTRGYTKHYRSRVAVLGGDRWKVCFIGRLCAADGYYGLGGHSFSGASGARATFATVAPGAVGDTVSHYEVWFARQPNGAELELRVDAEAPTRVSTSHPELENGWHTIDVEPGSHQLEIRPVGPGAARVFGVVAENAGPGVVWDSVTMVGAFTRRLNAYDADHIKAQVARRRPDLLVLNFGGNDLLRMVKGSLSGEAYKKELRVVLDRLRAGQPSMACLVAGIVDHGKSGGMRVQPKHVRRMIAAQREAAAEQGCGFFDTVAAMGGTGSMVRWASSHRLAERDLVHLTSRGRQRVAKMMYTALMDGYAEFKATDRRATADDR